MFAVIISIDQRLSAISMPDNIFLCHSQDLSPQWWQPHQSPDPASPLASYLHHHWITALCVISEQKDDAAGAKLDILALQQMCNEVF